MRGDPGLTETSLKRLEGRLREANEKIEAYLLVGDFNAHLRCLGYQEKNGNGGLINQFIEEKGLLLMNINDEYRGMYAWERRDSRSEIDFVFAKEKG